MRIDVYLTQTGHFESRNKAKEAVERGEVFVNGKIVKPSYEFTEGDVVTFSEANQFVSNGAFKLEKAFNDFDFDVKGKTVADIGASTGGFTQSLLIHGAAKVFAIDVGESLLHPSLKNDERVVPIENFNARFLDAETLGGQVDAVVSDVSFISLTYILGNISSVLKDEGKAVVLIKPQFECGKDFLSKNGIVTDKKARHNACIKVIDCAREFGLFAEGFSHAPIKEGKNIEYLLYLSKKCDNVVTIDDVLHSV